MGHTAIACALGPRIEHGCRRRMHRLHARSSNDHDSRSFPLLLDSRARLTRFAQTTALSARPRRRFGVSSYGLQPCSAAPSSLQTSRDAVTIRLDRLHSARSRPRDRRLDLTRPTACDGAERHMTHLMLMDTRQAAGRRGRNACAACPRHIRR
jgi:hypothetical protein